MLSLSFFLFLGGDVTSQRTLNDIVVGVSVELRKFCDEKNALLKKRGPFFGASPRPSTSPKKSRASLRDVVGDVPGSPAPKSQKVPSDDEVLSRGTRQAPPSPTSPAPSPPLKQAREKVEMMREKFEQELGRNEIPPPPGFEMDSNQENEVGFPKANGSKSWVIEEREEPAEDDHESLFLNNAGEGVLGLAGGPPLGLDEVDQTPARCQNSSYVSSSDAPRTSRALSSDVYVPGRDAGDHLHFPSSWDLFAVPSSWDVVEGSPADPEGQWETSTEDHPPFKDMFGNKLLPRTKHEKVLPLQEDEEVLLYPDFQKEGPAPGRFCLGEDNKSWAGLLKIKCPPPQSAGKEGFLSGRLGRWSPTLEAGAGGIQEGASGSKILKQAEQKSPALNGSELTLWPAGASGVLSTEEDEDHWSTSSSMWSAKQLLLARRSLGLKLKSADGTERDKRTAALTDRTHKQKNFLLTTSALVDREDVLLAARRTSTSSAPTYQSPTRPAASPTSYGDGSWSDSGSSSASPSIHQQPSRAGEKIKQEPLVIPSRAGDALVNRKLLHRVDSFASCSTACPTTPTHASSAIPRPASEDAVGASEKSQKRSAPLLEPVEGSETRFSCGNPVEPQPEPTDEVWHYRYGREWSYGDGGASFLSTM